MGEIYDCLLSYERKLSWSAYSKYYVKKKKKRYKNKFFFCNTDTISKYIFIIFLR